MAPAVPFDTFATGSRTGGPAVYRFAIGNNLEFLPRKNPRDIPFRPGGILILLPLFFHRNQELIAA
jgi:hypothetical protein